MNQVLKNILIEKEKEVSTLMANPYFSDLYKNALSVVNLSVTDKVFKRAVTSQSKSVIAEIKRKSPSKSHISDIPDPVKLAGKYMDGGACSISILTDVKFFGGSIDDLRKVKTAFGSNCCPILRKDFIIHPIQIVQAMDAGANCILLIIAALGRDKAYELLSFARHMGLDALVEVHTREEMETALDIGSDIIGINNRNLDTFEIDVGISKTLIGMIPDDIVKISESGIKSSGTAKELFKCGFNAVLVGEFLASARSPENLIKEMIG